MLCSQGCAVTYGSEAAPDATASAEIINAVCFSSGHRNRAPERNPRKEEGGCVDELWESRLMHRKETALWGEE